MLILNQVLAEDGWPKYDAHHMMPGAYHITNFITEQTTPDQFLNEVNKVQQYQWYYGGRCGWTAMDVCIHTNNWSLMKFLCTNGGDMVVNTKGCFDTPLITIINKIEDERKCLDMVMFLVKNGALVNLVIKKNFLERLISPLMCALMDKKYRIARYLLRQGAEIYPEIKEEVDKLYQRRTALTYAILTKCSSPLPNEIIDLIAQFL